MNCSRLLLSLATLVLLVSSTFAGQITIEKTDDGATIKIDGKLFTRYLVKSGAKPVLWPIIGPTGEEITRAYPITPGKPEERKDHVHHRSFWFTHGIVNGVDFWGEGDKSGTTKHREFVKVSDGDRAVIVTRNDWLGPDGKKQCEDMRTLTFGANDQSRWIDFDITIKASEGEVVFGDTKEGSFAVRVAGTMKITAKLGGKLVNSHGAINAKAWGQRAPWVDYHGPLHGKTVGIAILNHPSSFRYPTYWHVRDYGLFAANVFGLHHFKRSNEVDGSYKLPSGESLTFRYRVLLHKGDEKQADIAGAFSAYAKEKKDQ